MLHDLSLERSAMVAGAGTYGCEQEVIWAVVSRPLNERSTTFGRPKGVSSAGLGENLLSHVHAEKSGPRHVEEEERED